MSLKEQMLKAGLIDEKQARQAEHKHRQKDTKTSHGEREREAKKAREKIAAQAQAERERDRQRNQAREAEQTAQDSQGQGRQRRDNLRETIFRQGALENADGPKRFHFTDENRVYFLQVSDLAARKLEQGQAGIARLPGGGKQYRIITRKAAEELNELVPELLIVLHR